MLRLAPIVRHALLVAALLASGCASVPTHEEALGDDDDYLATAYYTPMCHDGDGRYAVRDNRHHGYYRYPAR